MFSRRGEISTAFLVSLIILIAGIVIMAFVFGQIIWGAEITKDSCHASVVLRGTTPQVANNFVPLKCQTEKVCLTNSLFGKCSGDGESFEGVDAVTKINVKNKLEVERAISRKVAECWSMMGEGKISIYSESLASQVGGGKPYPSCIICSRIAVDPSTSNIKDIVEADPYQYMLTHELAGKNISYMDYITHKLDGEVGVSFGGKLTSDKLNKFSTEINSFADNSGKTINLQELSRVPVAEKFDQLSVVFMQISTPSSEKVLNNVVNLGIAAVGIGAYGGGLKSISTAGRCLVNLYCVGAVLVVAGITIGATQYGAWVNQNVAASYCGDVGYGNSIRTGCSVVRVSPYTEKELNQYCKVIESLP